MSTRGDRCRAGLSAGLAIAALALLLASATACGGSAAILDEWRIDTASGPVGRRRAPAPRRH